MNREPKNILIRSVNWIGDAVLTIPSIRSLRRAFPAAHIALLARPWVSELFTSSTDIDEIILYDEKFKGLSGRFRLSRLLKNKRFDLAVLLQNAFDAALVTWMAGIPERVGYKRDGRGFLLTQAVPVDPDAPQQHQVYYYLNLLRAAGIEPVEEQPYIALTDDERTWARKLMRRQFSDLSSPVIGINPGAAFGSAKRWLPERFAALIIEIIQELNGRVLIFGGKSETEIADEIIAAVNRIKIEHRIQKTGSRILVMTGKTTLRELAALIAECDVFVTNDSGPMHMASALMVPVVAIFGSTDSSATGPFGDGHRVISRDLDCAPCMERKCPEGHLDCMTGISSEEVFTAVREALPGERAVFLDKDGTLIEDKHYLNSFDDLAVLRGVKSGLKKLKAAGFRLVGITNQSGIARGIVDRQFVEESNAHLQKELGIDAFYFCPHHPDDRCSCRKPEPLLLLKERMKGRVRLRDSYVIGDKESDVLLGKKTGATGILLSSAPLFEKTAAAYIAKDLGEAVAWILAQEDRK